MVTMTFEEDVDVGCWVLGYIEKEKKCEGDYREVVGAGGDLEGRLHVGIGIERPLGYLHNRFRN